MGKGHWGKKERGVREESLRRLRAILSDTSVVIFNMLKDLFF